jgi:hypothetical protein
MQTADEGDDVIDYLQADAPVADANTIVVGLTAEAFQSADFQN